MANQKLDIPTNNAEYDLKMKMFRFLKHQKELMKKLSEKFQQLKMNQSGC